MILPVDTPRVEAAALAELAAACVDAAVPDSGPLPGAYRRSALPTLERGLAAGELALHQALDAVDTRIVRIDASQLANVNTPDVLAAL